MGNLSNILVVLFSLSVVFVIAGASLHDINPDNDNILYDCNKTIMSQYGTCTNNDLNGAVPNDDASVVTTNLPTIDSTNSNLVSVVVQTISSVFTSVANWISHTLGLSYLQSAMYAPKLILVSMGLPALIVWAIAGLFLALLTFFFIDWIKGSFA